MNKIKELFSYKTSLIKFQDYLLGASEGQADGPQGPQVTNGLPPSKGAYEAPSTNFNKQKNKRVRTKEHVVVWSFSYSDFCTC